MKDLGKALRAYELLHSPEARPSERRMAERSAAEALRSKETA